MFISFVSSDLVSDVCIQETFSSTIRGFPKLRTLNLTLVKYPGGETLSSGAIRIALTNPRLEHFSLTFLPASYPVSLPFVFSLLALPFRTRDSGSFSLTCDHHGIPVALRASIKRRHFWPLTLGLPPSTKKYVKDLRPAGGPGMRQTGVKGLVELFMDNSSAGEEMRMIAFCVSLVCLAFWGLATSRR
jgi:hypothetical protein